ncbi:MAG: CBS domain-containing protein [Proteobacteria bacterium]|nr:MAG: CBS domain-containing protein [Pseudomonadota bacterium]
MREARHFVKDVSTVDLHASVRELAEKMRGDAVGCLVVTDERRRPIGIVTDRDLALRVVAAGKRARETTAERVMTKPVATVAPTESIEAVVARMRSDGIRRVPVVRDEQVVGIVSLDDLVAHLGDELDTLGTALRTQYRDARHGTGLERLLEDVRERLAPVNEQLERAGEKTRQVLLRELDALRERLQKR